MATLRVRFKLNPGRTGIVLTKLSKQTENIELFLRSLASDLGEDDGANLWLAKDFKEGSFVDTTEFQSVVDDDQVTRFNEAIQVLSKFKKDGTKCLPPDFVSPATIERFASLRANLDVDEKIGIATFDIKTGKAKRWSFVDRIQLEYIGQSIETEIEYIGSVMGSTHEWNKGAREPYIIIRDIATGDLVKCTYSDEDYGKVAKLFSEKSAIVVIEGLCKFNRITEKVEMTKAQDFGLAPNFSGNDFEQFFGCAPGLTGDLSTDEFIAKGRDDER